MAERAAARPRRRRGIGAIGPVRDIFPLAVAEILIVRAEALLFSHDEQRRQLVGNETAVVIEQRLPITVLLNRVALEENDRAIRKIERVTRHHRSRRWIGINAPNLTVLVVVEPIEELVGVL